MKIKASDFFLSDNQQFSIVGGILSKIKQSRALLLRFFKGQLLIQFFNLLNGFLLLRWLDIEEQAIFSLSFGMQSLINQLSDLGFSGSIIALAGRDYDNKQILGQIIKSAKYFRKLLFFGSVTVGLILVPVFTKTKFSNPYVLWLNLIPILAAVYWEANLSIYGTPLIIHKDMKKYYKPQIVVAIFKLFINYLLFLSHHISSFSILILNALAMLYIGNEYKKYSDKYYQKDVAFEKTKDKMFKYILPLIPSLIFNAFFAQIQVFIISLFGKVRNIAEVAALGKLSQIFMLLGAFNMMIVEPMIAKSNHAELFKRYMLICVMAFSIAGLLTLSSYLFPGIYLLALGSKYAALSKQLIWVIGAAALAFVQGTLWTMHSARKWVFWWGSAFYILMIVCCQVLGITMFDISTTMGVLQLSFLTAVGILIVQISIGVVGFRKDGYEFSIS
ncbi:polysaccharide biosynthesis protein [Mucilaginibacter agri]|uniref:Membrane protein involved in the export of O-antigen and teichoic acid n=1 Tax=Mucilaginibacter agri TaxID=2695265 RepID=A0A966DS00_9SPHI|nr:hypothetical protein [Mucilaginibacter agri]NCD67811.1 hypothetical protein [Mucilaginibacter agri]